MSKYGFDLDGTLDVDEVKQLANDLYDAGHEIHIVTGAINDTGEWTEAARHEKLARLGVRWTKLHRCFGSNITKIGDRKKEVCKEEKLILLFEDSQDFIGQVMRDTQCLYVVPR